MKKILLIFLFSFVAFFTKSQTIQYLGAPLTRVETRGQFIVDSVFWPTLRDTTFTPNFPGAMTFNPGDQTFYGYFNGKWNSFAKPVWGNITGSITNQIDLYDSLLARQYTIVNGYGIKVIAGQPTFDSAGVRKVDTVYRKTGKDSIYFSINGKVYQFLDSVGGSGSVSVGLALPTSVFTVTGSPTSNGTLIGNFNNQNANSIFAGPASGSPGQPLFRSMVIADLPTNIPVANLAANTIGLNLTSTGTLPGVTVTPAILGTSLTLNVPFAGPGSTGFLTTADWNTFNGRVISVNGQHGVTVVGNADSLMTLPIDTTTDRNNYVLTFDSTDRKWKLTAGGAGGGTGTLDSVKLSMPAIFNVTGSPGTGVTANLGVTLANQTTNLVFASPNGSTGAPTFRSLAYPDLPTSGVSAGSYTIASITVNAQGIITAASNGTGGPILSLNGLNAATQVFAIGSAGTSPNIVSATATHTFNFPYATPSDTGLVTPAQVTLWNSKQAALTIGNLTSPGSVLTVTGGTGAVIGSGTTVTLPSLVSAGSCTSCNITTDAYGRITAYANGSGGPDTATFVGIGLTVTRGPGAKITLAVDTSIHDTTHIVFNPSTINGATYAYANADSIYFAKLIAGTGFTIDSTTNPGALTFRVTGAGTGTVSAAINGTQLSVTGDSVLWGGPLTQNTTIAQASYTTTFTGTVTSSMITATNSGTGAAITGIGTSNSGIVGESGSGPAAFFTSTLGYGLLADVDPTSTNTSLQIAVFRHTVSGGGTPAPGIGGYLSFHAATTANGDEESGRIESIWSNATTTSRTNTWNIYGYNNATLQTQLSLLGSGQAQFPQYGKGTFTGTAVYNILEDASGNLIEGAVPVGAVIGAKNGITVVSGDTLEWKGLLTQNDTLTGGSYFSVFTSSAANGMKITDSANSGVGLRINAVGTGSEGLSATGVSYGIYGQGAVEGVEGFSTSGFGVNATSQTGIALYIHDQHAGNNNTITPGMFLDRQPMTPNTLTGFGTSIYFALPDSVNTEDTTGIISSYWTNSQDSTAAMQFSVLNAGVKTIGATLYGIGQLQLNQYTSSNSALKSTAGDTTDYKPTVMDANGNVFRSPSWYGGGGGGGLAHDTATLSSNGSITVSGKSAIYMIIVVPTSPLTSFQVGITSSTAEVIANQSIPATSTVFTTNYWMAGNTTLYFQGITSSTFITVIPL